MALHTGQKSGLEEYAKVREIQVQGIQWPPRGQVAVDERQRAWGASEQQKMHSQDPAKTAKSGNPSGRSENA